MDEIKSYDAEVKSRGQLTIPKKIREAGYLEEGQRVSLIPVGDSLVVTPKALKLEEARREMRRIMKASGITLEELLAGLGEERELLHRETYGRKKA